MKDFDSNHSTQGPPVIQIRRCGSVTIRLIGTVSGREPAMETVSVVGPGYGPGMQGILVDNEQLMPLAPIGSVFVVDPERDVEVGCRVVLRRVGHPGYRPCWLVRGSARAITVQPFQAAMREEAGGPGLVDAETWTLRLREVVSMQRVVGLQYPG